MIKTMIPTPMTASVPSYVGMPISACASVVAADNGAVAVRVRWDDFALAGAVAGVKGGLRHIQTTATPGTTAWRPPIC